MTTTAQSVNFREKIVQENLATVNEHPELLTDWEREFMQTMNAYATPATCSCPQFNRLKEIAERVKDLTT